VKPDEEIESLVRWSCYARVFCIPLYEYICLHERILPGVCSIPSACRNLRGRAVDAMRSMDQLEASGYFNATS